MHTLAVVLLWCVCRCSTACPPALQVCSLQVTCMTRSGGRPSQQQAAAAWQHSVRSATSQPMAWLASLSSRSSLTTR